MFTLASTFFWLIFINLPIFIITPFLSRTTPTLSGLIVGQLNVNRLQFLSFLLLTELIHIYRDLNNLSKSFCFFSTSNKYFLIFSKRNESSSTNLEVKIDTVDQTIFSKVIITQTEEVLSIQFSITTSKRLTQTRILTLHQLLNTCILNHVDEIPRTSCCITPVFVGGEESMSHLMTHEHVIDDARSTVPVW